MSGQLWFVLVAGVLAGLGAGVPLGLWRGRRVGLEDAKEDGYNAGLGDYEDGYKHGYSDAHDARDEWDRQQNAVCVPLQVGHTIYPELVALAAQDVPEPVADSSGLGYESRHAGASPGVATGDGLGHPSPYTGPLTPAQRRRDKHKQRGPYAPGDLPDPPTDVGAWWQAELDALLEDGQSEWLTRNLAGAA